MANGVEYCYTEGERDYRKTPILVRFTGSPKVVGEIRYIGNGWQYFPKGSKTGGDIFKTIEQCQQSLEGDS